MAGLITKGRGLGKRAAGAADRLIALDASLGRRIVTLSFAVQAGHLGECRFDCSCRERTSGSSVAGWGNLKVATGKGRWNSSRCDE